MSVATDLMELDSNPGSPTPPLELWDIDLDVQCNGHVHIYAAGQCVIGSTARENDSFVIHSVLP